MFPDLSRKCGWMTCLLGRRKDMCGRRKGKWMIGTGWGWPWWASSWHQDWGGIVGKTLTAKISQHMARNPAPSKQWQCCTQTPLTAPTNVDGAQMSGCGRVVCVLKTAQGWSCKHVFHCRVRLAPHPPPVSTEVDCSKVTEHIVGCCTCSANFQLTWSMQVPWRKIRIFLCKCNQNDWNSSFPRYLSTVLQHLFCTPATLKMPDSDICIFPSPYYFKGLFFIIMIFFPLSHLLGISLKLVYFLNGKLFFFSFFLSQRNLYQSSLLLGCHCTLWCYFPNTYVTVDVSSPRLCGLWGLITVSFWLAFFRSLHSAWNNIKSNQQIC